MLDKKNRIDITEDFRQNPVKPSPAQNAWSRPASHNQPDRHERQHEPSRRLEGRRDPAPYFEEAQPPKPGNRPSSPEEPQPLQIHNEGVISAILALIKELPPGEISLIKKDITRTLGL